MDAAVRRVGSGTSCLEVAYVARAFPGERVSGDRVIVSERGDTILVAIIDALGHGPEAAEVADRASAFLEQSWTDDPVPTLEALHRELLGSRGLVAGVAVFDSVHGTGRYGAVGNTEFRVLGAAPRSLVSSHGIVGSRMPRVSVQSFELQSDDVAIMTTDGVSGRGEWPLRPSFLLRDVASIARSLVEEFGRATDDATSAAFRYVL